MEAAAACCVLTLWWNSSYFSSSVYIHAHIDTHMWKEREKKPFYYAHYGREKNKKRGERKKKSLLSVDNSWHTRARVLPIIWKLPFSLLDVVPERRWVEGCWLATRAPSSIFFFQKKNIIYILYIRETSFDWKNSKCIYKSSMMR